MPTETTAGRIKMQDVTLRDEAGNVLSFVNGKLPVDIAENITVEATIVNTSVEISNDVGNPVPVQQADLDSDVDEVSTFEGAISKRIDEASATVTYIGEAVIGTAEGSALWRIRKIDFTNPTSIKWAASAAFSQIWTNRAALTYT